MCEPLLKIRDIMCKDIVTAKEDLTIQEAIQLLYERHVGSIIVVDDEYRCIGVFTERDAIRIVANKFSTDEKLGKVMSRRVVTISVESSFEEAKHLVLAHDIRHLPVTDQAGKLVGLFSVRAFFDEILSMKTLPQTEI